jgi:hypothetical protein
VPGTGCGAKGVEMTNFENIEPEYEFGTFSFSYWRIAESLMCVMDDFGNAVPVGYMYGYNDALRGIH